MKSILDKADPNTHEMSMQDLIPLFEAAAETKEIKLGPCIQESFSVCFDILSIIGAEFALAGT